METPHHTFEQFRNRCIGHKPLQPQDWKAQFLDSNILRFGGGQNRWEISCFLGIIFLKAGVNLGWQKMEYLLQWSFCMWLSKTGSWTGGAKVDKAKVNRCCAVGCRSGYKDENEPPDVTLHRFLDDLKSKRLGQGLFPEQTGNQHKTPDSAACILWHQTFQKSAVIQIKPGKRKGTVAFPQDTKENCNSISVS